MIQQYTVKGSLSQELISAYVLYCSYCVYYTYMLYCIVAIYWVSYIGTVLYFLNLHIFI